MIHYSLAMAYRGLGDQQRAESHLQQRGTLQTKPDPLIKALDELLNSALTYERNADVAGSRGEWSEAAEYLRKAVALAPDARIAASQVGDRALLPEDRRGAVEEFQEALRLSPDFSAAHYALGVLHDEAGAASAGHWVLFRRARIRAWQCRRASRAGERVEAQRSARTIVVGVRAHLEGRSRRGRGAFWLRGGARPPQSISRTLYVGWLRR